MSGTFRLSWGLTALNPLLPQSQVQTLHRWARVAEEEGAVRVLSHQGDFKTTGQAPDFPLPALPAGPQCQPPVPAQPSQATDGALKTSPGSGPRVRMSAGTGRSPFIRRHACGEGSPSSLLAEEGLAGLGGLITRGHRQSFGPGSGPGR